jgi:hypothetical protein
MAGLLEGDYGAGEEPRARVIKIIVVSVLALTAIAGTVYFFFHNYREEQQVRHFMKLLEARDYQGAYNLWTGSDSARARYPMSDFMQDWGPPGDVSGYVILDAESCDKSVIVDVDAGHVGDRKVWVERGWRAGGAYPPTVFVGVYAPLEMCGAQTCQKAARLRHPRDESRVPTPDPSIPNPESRKRP